MNSRFLIVTLLLFFPGINSKATHIVGGDFSLQHVGGQGGNDYEMALILYYDLDKGLDIPDSVIQINVFKLADKKGAGKFNLVKEGNPVLLEFRNEKCKERAFSVQAFRYSAIVTLNPFNYADPEGYYAVWQRCCRNSGLSNVDNSEYKGMAYYLEFPSLVEYPRNSLPQFEPIKREYFCPNRVSTFSSSASDADGDQLVYSLEVPIRGNAQSQGNTVLDDPGPYPLEESYRPIDGFSGLPGISINSTTGEVTLAPRNAGVFLYSVRVQEFRGGKKLGEVRRDFEIVVQPCGSNDTPSVVLIPKGWDVPYRFGKDTLFIRDTGDFCHTLVADDPNKDPELTILVSPESAYNADFSVAPNLIKLEDGTYPPSKVCFPICRSRDKASPLTVEITVEDDACPLGYSTTQKIVLVPDFPENAPPEIDSDYIPGVKDPGEEVVFNVISTDIDPLDFVNLELIDSDELLKNYGIEFSSEDGIQEARGEFRWLPDCRVRNLEKMKLEFLSFDNKCNGEESEVFQVEIQFDKTKEEAFEPKPLQNVITANGDGKNDYLDLNPISNFECQNGAFVEYQIYDRWGKLIHSGGSAEEGWYPGNIPAGTYFYIIFFERGELKGYLNLLR